MHNNFFYKKYQNLTDTELKEIINDVQSYTKDAVLAANQLLQEREIEITQEQKASVQTIVEKSSAANSKKEKTEPSLIYKRFGAFLIDLGILSAISHLVGYSFMGVGILQMPWEPLFSLTLIMSYFVLAGKITGESTIGKGLMGLKIVKHNNKNLDIKDLLIKYSIIFTPFFLFEIIEWYSINSYGIFYGLTWCYYFAILYFVIIDKKLRRSYHDILSNTFVRNSDDNNVQYEEYPTRKIKHFFAICPIIIAAFMLLSVYFQFGNSHVSNQSKQTEMLQKNLEDNISTFERMITDIQKLKSVNNVENINLNTKNGVTTLKISVYPNSFKHSDEVIERIYDFVKNKELKDVTVDFIDIELNSGYDLTFASYHKIRSKSFEQ